MLKRLSFFALSSLILTACQSNTIQPVSDAEALARLERLEQLDAKEYPKQRSRAEDAYQDFKRQRLDTLEAERIHYQNQGIQYQNSRQRTRDMIDDIGRMQMNEAKAINKANENRSKKKDIYIFR